MSGPVALSKVTGSNPPVPPDIQRTATGQKTEQQQHN